MCFLIACQNSTEKAATKATTALTNTENAAANFGLAGAEKNLPAASNFFQSLLSGNWNDVMSVLQPQVSSLTAEYAKATTQAEEFAPRGGGRTATLANLPYEEANQISNLVGQARSGAATSLADIGLGELSGSTAAAEEGLSGAASQQQSQQNQQQLQAQAGEGVGSLIALLAGA